LSVILTPANPTSLSNGLGYYLAGVYYDFKVQVIDPDVVAWGTVATTLTIPNPGNANIVLTLTPTGTGNFTAPALGGTGYPIDANADVIGTYNNFTITFHVRPRWNTANSTPHWQAINNVTASAVETNTIIDTKIVPYGFCSNVRVLGFAQDGWASTGRVTPYHPTFNITGAFVYDVPGASLSDKVNVRANNELTAASLRINLLDATSTLPTPIPAVGGLTNTPVSDISIAVPASYLFIRFNAGQIALGNQLWRIQATATTGGGPKISMNTLTINTDRIVVDSLIFYNGGGRDAAPNYYRSFTANSPPLTRVRISAYRENAGAGNYVIGNTDFIISDGTNDTIVTILNGQQYGNAVLSAVPNPGVNVTAPYTYSVTRVYNGAYDGNDPLYGQNAALRISQPAGRVIYWDNGDPPGAPVGPPPLPGPPPYFTSLTSSTSTAVSFRLDWTALVVGAPHYDGDFDSYKLYYKRSADPTYLIVDRNTLGYAALGVIGNTTLTIAGLLPNTPYDFQLSAVDVHGQEVATVYRLSGTINTLVSSIELTLTDGVTFFEDDTFTKDGSANARQLRQTAIRAEYTIVTAGGEPDEVYMIVTLDGVSDIINTLVFPNVPIGVEGTDYYRIKCERSGPNKWRGYIPETNPLIKLGKSVRFVTEIVRGTSRSYADHNSETEPPAGGNPNDYPYRFTISTATTFTPWPTRILNNVITNENPVAYPAYYLTEDAYVTIKVYDIKGRPVATILDGAFRKGGQNIKEGGWRGTNKSNKKLGIGLYYIHIRAVRSGGGGVILNKFMKVVMAK